MSDIETRVRTAISALEQGGYLERGNNVPHVYATGITVKNMDEARKRITESILFDKDEIENAIRIIKSLISQKNISKAQDPEGESRIDYLADTLGLNKHDIISSVERMRQEGILADSKDMSVFLIDNDTERKTRNLLDKFARLEHYILARISDESLKISYKQLNEDAISYGISTSLEKDIKTLLYFLTIKGYTYKNEDGARNIEITRKAEKEATLARHQKRIDISRFIVEWLYQLAKDKARTATKTIAIQFSIVELLKEMQQYGNSLFNSFSNLQLEDVEEALLYLSRIGALKLEGGFLVLYNAMEIRRIKDNKRNYKLEDYRMLNEFYKQKIQQIHIVGEYANLMVRDYNAALQYVQDYFQMDYKKFISKYFKEEERQKQIQRNITPKKYKQLFSSLSQKQLEIINDKESRCIVVAAGPGSGKMATCLSQLYHEHKRKVNAGYAKFETFPIWNIPLKHPVNLAYEAATADLNDVNMIDPFHLDAYGVTAVNYNRDVEIFPVLDAIFEKIYGNNPYKSPTDMGVNMAGNCICDDEICREASNQEIIRRYYAALKGIVEGTSEEDEAYKIELLMKQAEERSSPYRNPRFHLHSETASRLEDRRPARKYVANGVGGIRRTRHGTDASADIYRNASEPNV